MAGTPVASPQVSSTVGLKNVVIAPLVTDTDAEHTYGDLQLLAGAIEASITPENADPDIQYADDVRSVAMALRMRSAIAVGSVSLQRLR